MRPDALECAVARLFAGDESARGQIRRLVAKAVGRKPHPDGLARAMALRIAGTCVFCEEPVTGARVTCARADCKQAYQRAYHRDMRSARGQRVRAVHAR